MLAQLYIGILILITVSLNTIAQVFSKGWHKREYSKFVFTEWYFRIRIEYHSVSCSSQ